MGGMMGGMGGGGMGAPSGGGMMGGGGIMGFLGGMFGGGGETKKDSFQEHLLKMAMTQLQDPQTQAMLKQLMSGQGGPDAGFNFMQSMLGGMGGMSGMSGMGGAPAAGSLGGGIGMG